MGLFNLANYFGSAHVTQNKDNTVTLSGIDTDKLIKDIDTIWKNNRIVKNMFREIRRYSCIIDDFFLPDVKYVLSQIYELKHKHSNKYRLKQLLDQIDEKTWMISTLEKHEDILDFSQLRMLKHTLFEHQINTLKVYNEKVPKMKLKGFLLSTPPGCITGDAIVTIRRGGKRFNILLALAQKYYNQDAEEYKNWNLNTPTYVRALVNGKFAFHPVHSIVDSGIQDVFQIKLADGKTLKTTATHLIMTEDGYVQAQYIINKFVMVDSRFSKERIAYVEAISCEYVGRQQTYDIVCKEPHHNFIANDIVVHNSGKTIMSIALSQCLHADVSFYIVPKNTVSTVWFDGLVEELGPDAKIWASDHNVPISDQYDHYIFHYEALSQAIHIAEQLNITRKNPFIAIDESHNLNEISSSRTLKLIDLVQTLNCQNTVFASGTPIKALGTETIPLLRCIDSFFTDEVEERFKAIYGLTAKRANDILRNRLGLISHKIAEDSYMTAPKPIEKEIFVKAPGADKYTIKNIKKDMTKFMQDKHQYYKSHMRQYLTVFNQGIDYYEKTLKTSKDRADLNLYRQYVKTIIEDYNPIEHQAIAKWTKDFEHDKILPVLPVSLRKSFKDSISIIKYTKARILGEALGWLSGKRAECTSLIAQHANLASYITEADKKTIIFSSYVPSIITANDLLVKQGFKTLKIYGDYTKQITEIITQFKKDPDINPLLGTYKSLSASQTLTNANVILLLDVPFRDYVREQALHRTYRIGQDTQTYIFSFFLQTVDPNLSTRADEILKWSQSQIQSLFGSMDKEEIPGIVKRLHLNPTSGIDHLLDMIKNLKFF